MKKFSIANVLDCELTCYQDGIFPPGEVKEVIEFGLCQVDLIELTISPALSIPVKPATRIISDYCTNLTGWTLQKLRRQGVPFDVALRRLVSKYGSKSRLLITDSDGDPEFVRTQCARTTPQLHYPFGATFNASTLFTLMTGQTRNFSLVEKLQFLGLTFEGRQHSAADDAFNIARLFVKLMQIARGNAQSIVPMAGEACLDPTVIFGKGNT